MTAWFQITDLKQRDEPYIICILVAMKKIAFLLFLLLPGVLWAQKGWQTFTTDSFIHTKEGKDTLSALSLFHKHIWDVTVRDNDGSVRSFVTARPDTINARHVASIDFSAVFWVDPSLVYHDLALNYDLSGSMMMKLNGKLVLATGIFAKDRDSRLARLEPSGYVNFLFDDTLEKIEINYLTHPRIRTLDLNLVVFQLNNGFEDYYQATETNATTQFFSFGLYYLAFAVIFLMLFFYFRENRENLYFSLLCFFISVAFFSATFWGLYSAAMSSFAAVLATEFACIFLARVFRDKDRTKVPLILVCILGGVCLYPDVLYGQVSFFGKREVSLGLWVISNLLFVYELYLTVYILLWGLRRRNRESNTIFIFSLITAALYVMFPITSVLIPGLKNLSFVSYVHLVPNLGLCLFPIGYAIVLGKRNGDNQKQLLEKEQEKKRILEGQKESLERDVALRTQEVVRQKEEIEKQHDELKIEKKKSDDLLLNILPGEVAEELKETGHSEARFFNDVTVLFTDFADFTKAGERMSPQELVDELHICFKTFDDIVTRHGIEKIKTIGDAYLAVCGLPLPVAAHAVQAVHAAQEIMQFMIARKEQLKDKAFGIRIGVHSGSVVAGIVGVKKFAYDIWGDTVNTAARMEQNSEAGKINISQTTYELVKDKVKCTYRGEIDAKGKGMMKMYYVG